MSRREVTAVAFDSPTAVGSGETTLLDWRSFDSQMPSWDRLFVTVVNLDPSNAVVATLYTSAVPPHEEEGLDLQVPAGKQRTFLVDSVCCSDFVCLVARTSFPDTTASVVFRVIAQKDVSTVR